MIDLHSRIKFAGADTHESYPVAMGLVHICLYLKYKGRKITAKGIYLTLVGLSGKRCLRHFQKVIEEKLHAEISQGRAKEHGRQFTLIHSLLIKFGTGSVQKLQFLSQLIISLLSDGGYECAFIIYGYLFHMAFLGALLGVGVQKYSSFISVIDTLKSLS